MKTYKDLLQSLTSNFDQLAKQPIVLIDPGDDLPAEAELDFVLSEDGQWQIKISWVKFTDDYLEQHKQGGVCYDCDD
jgi:hypothetical protein|tara:strand:- start:283 stop:513 length:231 start_codon:yes stop_codon:yes gene_type:complete